MVEGINIHESKEYKAFMVFEKYYLKIIFYTFDNPSKKQPKIIFEKPTIKNPRMSFKINK